MILKYDLSPFDNDDHNNSNHDNRQKNADDDNRHNPRRLTGGRLHFCHHTNLDGIDGNV